jgi:hypothetical protein
MKDALAHVIADNELMLFATIDLQTFFSDRFIIRICKKCGKSMKVLPRVSVRYYGKTEIQLCPVCRRDNRKASLKRSQIRRRLKLQTQERRLDTHSTPKRRAYEILDVIFNYSNESKIDENI